MVSEKYYDGLIAEWYDDWLKERKDDIAFYAGFFTGFKGRVLELACGTGRILLPIARQGIKAEGLDSSADMLSKLMAKAVASEMPPITTYRQSMSRFELPHRYDAIVLATGSFQLLISEGEALACLEASRRHLEENGFLLLEAFVPWDSIRAEKVDAFTVTRDVKREDGSRCIVSEKFRVDVARQVVESVFRYEVFRNGHLETSLIGDFPLRWYWKDEIEKLVRTAGFAGVEFLTSSLLYKEGSTFIIQAS